MICESSNQIRIQDLGKNPHELVKRWGLPFMITATPCNYGGDRHWFVCPGCRRRCAVLYPACCRKCCKGRYKSELATPQNRKVIKALKLRERLGQTAGGIYAHFPHKPKWMRWKTYWRIREEGEALEKEINAETEKWLKNMGVKFVSKNASEADDDLKGYEF